MPNSKAEQVWPCSLRDLTQEDLLSFDDFEFQKLKSLFIERELSPTKSKRHAREIARALKNKRTPYSYSTLPIHIKEHVKTWKYKHSNLCETAIEHHDKIINGFSNMRNDALPEAEMLRGKEATVDAIKKLINSVIEVQIEVSQKIETA